METCNAIDVKPVPKSTPKGAVRLVRARAVRALTYTSFGGRCETWLPVGYWRVEGDCLVRAGRDGGELVPALILLRPAPLTQDGVWYVAPAALGLGK